MAPTTFFDTGNSWVTAHAPRAAYLIDGENYFSAFARAAMQAEETIFVLGWDLDSRLELVKAEIDGYPRGLGRFLDELVRRKPRLNIYLVLWDYALLYLAEREHFPRLKLGWRTHRRIHFALDDGVPVGASQHQKIVVIDDALAFTGGFDLALERWDTREHEPGDPRRTDLAGRPYAPFHDVQMMLNGEAARRLGELARNRWRLACGREVKGPSAFPERWLGGLTPNFENVTIGIARTVPETPVTRSVTEVLELHEAAIRRARHSIYLENQYLSSHRIGRLLAERLQEDDGPEVLIVAPRHMPGWLEEQTMGVLRNRLLSELREADTHGRLRVYAPVTNTPQRTPVMVHSKVFVVDDEILKVGSSNLSNRSMGYDSECDVAIAAENDEQRRRIAEFRNSLLGEHLGVAPLVVEREVLGRGSLIRAVDAINAATARLVEIETQVPDAVSRLVVDEAIDPERPVSALLAEKLRLEGAGADSKRGWLKFGIMVGLAVAAYLTWQLTPLNRYLDLETLAGIGRQLERLPYGPILVVGGFVAAAVSFFPITLLILGLGLIYEPMTALAYAMCGIALSSLIGYGFGRVMRREGRFTRNRIERARRWLQDRSLLGVIAIRNMPIAPYGAINAAAGAMHVDLRGYFFGTLLGMLPGTTAIILLEHQFASLIVNPSWRSAAVLLGVLATVVAGGLLVRRKLRAGGQKV